MFNGNIIGNEDKLTSFVPNQTFTELSFFF